MKNNLADKNKIQRLNDKIDTLTETVSKLKKSDQLLIDAVNYAPIGMVTLAIDGKFKTVNKAFCQIVGYTKKELLTSNIGQITHPDDKRIGNNVIDELTSGKAKKANFEKRYIHKNGTTIYAQVSTVILKDDLGSPINFFTQVVDVTKQRYANEALRKSEEQLRLITENTSDNIAIVTFDLKATYIYVNPSVKSLLGYDPKDLLGNSFFDFIHPEDKKILLPLFKKYINQKSKMLMSGKELPISETIEFRFKDKIGNWRFMQSTVNIVGKQLLSVTRDVTEQKITESKFKQNEKILQNIIDTSPNCMFLKDRNGMYLMVNKSMAELHGKKSADLVGKYDYEIAKKWFETTDYNKFRKAEQNVIDNNKTLTIIEELFVYQGGTKRWFQTTKIPFILEDNLNCILVISTDITEHKLMEEALIESENRLALAVEGAGLGLWDQDFSSGIIIRNERWAQMLGYELDEIEQNRSAWKNIIHKDDIANLEINIKEHEEGRSSIFSVEHRMRKKNGEWKWIHNWGKIIERDKNGRPLRAIGVHLDINTRKLAEQQIEKKSTELEKQFKSSEMQRIATLSALSDLNETTKKLQTEIIEHKKSAKELVNANKNLEMLAKTVRSMNECVSITDQDHKIIFVNEAWEKTYGYKKEEAIGKTSKIIEVKEKTDLKNKMRKQTKLGGWKGELTNQKKDGTIFPTELSITPLRDVKGNIIAQIGISSDITERKQMEIAQKDNEDKLEQAQKIAKLGHYSFDVKTGNWTSSEELDNIFGIDENFKRDLNGWLQIIHTDFQEKMSNYFQNNILKQHQNFDKEYKILSIKTNQEKWVHGLGKLKFDENKNLIEMFGTIQDITDRKKTESALLESEIKYRKFFMEDLTGDFLSTRDGKIIDCNPQFMKIFGFKSIEQAQKYNTNKLYKSKSEREIFIKRLEKHKVLLDQRFEQYKVNGEKIIIEENCSGEFDQKGKLINIKGYMYDITERVKAEREVRKLSTAVEQSPVSIMITDTDGIIEYVNPKFEKITGYSLKESVGTKPSVLKSGVTPDSEYKNLWKTITKGEIWVGEFLNKKKSGELYWESATISPIMDDKNNITHYLAVKEDITEQKNIIGELMDREEKYRTLTQNLNTGVYRNSPGKNGRFLEANPAFLKIFGFRNRNELDRFKVADLYPDLEARNKIEEKLSFKGFLMNEEIQLRKKDGTLFYASISTTAAIDEIGNVTHYDGIIEDISERKAMVEQIIQERDKSQLYLDIAGVMFLALDRKGDVILANQKTCEIIGTTEKNLIGKNWFDNYIPKNNRLDLRINLFNKLMDGEGDLVQFYENEILTANGEKRLIEWRNNILKDDFDNIIGIISSGLDITERKEAEDLRTKLYETSRNLAESLDIDEVLFRMSKQARSLLKCNGVTIYMLEDDKKTLNPVVAYDPPYTKQVLATKIGVNNSLTGQSIKAKKGKIFNFHDSIKGAFHIKGTPEKDRDNIIVSPLEIDGEIIGALTLVRSDIPFTDRDLSIVNTFAVYGSTAIKNANSHQLLQYEIGERMQTEKLLKESRDRYESIFDSTVDGIVYTDRKGNILSVNSAFIKITGMKKDELIGKNGITLIKQLSPTLNNLDNIKFIKSVLNGEVVNGFPVEFINKSLELFTPGGKNKPGVTILIRDVTERNKARENILNYQTDLKSLTNELIIAEERAKRRLAVTLHDKLGQYLALANFKTNELSKLTTNSDNKKIIGEITSFIDDAIKESRDITYELSPPVLYEMGLIPAISWKLDEIEKNNKIKTSLIDQSKSYEFEKREQIVIYRGISELLLNVLKHSKSDSVNISFRRLTNVYRITVTDTGIGFDLEKMKEKAVSEKKFGLFSIIERIKYIGGEVNIDSIPNRGTKVVIDIPIK